MLIATYHSLVDEPFLKFKRPRERIPGHADYRIKRKNQDINRRGTFFIYTFVWKSRPCFLCGGRILVKTKRIHTIIGALADPKPAMEMAERICDELDIGFMRRQKIFWFAREDGPGDYKPTLGLHSRKRSKEDLQAQAYRARLGIKKHGKEYHERMKDYTLPGSEQEEGDDADRDSSKDHLL